MTLVCLEEVEEVRLEEIRMDRSADGVNEKLDSFWLVSLFIYETQHTALKFSL